MSDERSVSDASARRTQYTVQERAALEHGEMTAEGLRTMRALADQCERCGIDRENRDGEDAGPICWDCQDPMLTRCHACLEVVDEWHCVAGGTLLCDDCFESTGMVCGEHDDC